MLLRRNLAFRTPRRLGEASPGVIAAQHRRTWNPAHHAYLPHRCTASRVSEQSRLDARTSATCASSDCSTVKSIVGRSVVEPPGSIAVVDERIARRDATQWCWRKTGKSKDAIRSRRPGDVEWDSLHFRHPDRNRRHRAVQRFAGRGSRSTKKWTKSPACRVTWWAISGREAPACLSSTG